MTAFECTGSDLLLESLYQGGVEVIFANLGTDHAGLIESWAKHEVPGSAPVPKLIMCPHESTAINAALAYGQVRGRAQGAFVHVDVGTLNLGAGVHNASRSRLPVFLFAGVAPWTEFGERPGGRSIPPHWFQDAYDQAGSVREYIKWEYEIRAGSNAHHVVARGLQMANATPAGPVYVTAAREPLEEQVAGGWQPIEMACPAPVVPQPAMLRSLVEKLRTARRPVAITGGAGRSPEAVAALGEFADRFVIPVVEVRQQMVNLPADHPLHLGYRSAEFVREADLILVLDCDLPWLPSGVQPPPEATVVWLGSDPLCSYMPMRSLPAHMVFAADITATLRELTALGEVTPAPDGEALARRRSALTNQHEAQRAQWRITGTQSGELTAAHVARLVAEIGGDQTVVINEAVTNQLAVTEQLNRRHPGTLLANAGSGLGMGMPAALGAKLAAPDADVVAIVGDGSYMFGIPTSVHWCARAYGAPFMTVILNNARWQAVADATVDVNPTGLSARGGVPQAKFPEPADLSVVVTSAGGIGLKARTAEEAARAITEGFALLGTGRSVVIDVRLP